MKVRLNSSIAGQLLKQKIEQMQASRTSDISEPTCAISKSAGDPQTKQKLSYTIGQKLLTGLNSLISSNPEYNVRDYDLSLKPRPMSTRFAGERTVSLSLTLTIVK